MKVQAVCFDAFGTLCRIGERRRPYEKLFTRLGVDLRTGAELAMTTNGSLVDVAEKFGDVRASEGLVEELAPELDSITLFDDVIPVLEKLKQIGIRLWVISNLANPYGIRLRQLLDGIVDGYSLSFEVGAMKPDPIIFAHACAGLCIDPNQVMMIGDSRKADMEGAEAFGMRGIWLRRDQSSNHVQSVRSLNELVESLIANRG